jgi:hypothetical protein
MATAITRTPATVGDTLSVSPYRTVADLLEHLGGIAPSRVRFQPRPGTATVRDVIAVHDTENRLCQTVDQRLVRRGTQERGALFTKNIKDNGSSKRLRRSGSGEAQRSNPWRASGVA